jgi:hypothetical protein
LFAIANSVGTPICTYFASAKPMIERTFGQYARVLVDMDVTQTLRYKVLVERKGFAFFAELDYENIPNFCNNCKKIGHHIGICKKLINDETIENKAIPNRNFNEARKEIWKKKSDVSKQGKHASDPIIVDGLKAAEVNEKTLKNNTAMVFEKVCPSGTK